MKLPTELEKIIGQREMMCGPEGIRDYEDGLRDCYEAMSKTHMSFEASEALKADCYAEMKRTHAPLADVQVLLDAIKKFQASHACHHGVSCDDDGIDNALEAFNRARQAGGGE